MLAKTRILITSAVVLGGVLALAIGNADYTVDGLHSCVAFKVPVAGGLTHLHGRFNRFHAELRYVPNDFSKSSVKAVIEVTSLDTGVPGRDKHTLGPDGFNAAKYPEITFVSKKIVKADNGFTAVGDLTMKGVRREVQVFFRPTGSDTISKGVTLLGFEGAFKLNRRDYGLKWEMPHSPKWIGDDVEVDISVLARPS